MAVLAGRYGTRLRLCLNRQRYVLPENVRLRLKQVDICTLQLRRP